MTRTRNIRSETEANADALRECPQAPPTISINGAQKFNKVYQSGFATMTRLLRD